MYTGQISDYECANGNLAELFTRFRPQKHFVPPVSINVGRNCQCVALTGLSALQASKGPANCKVYWGMVEMRRGESSSIAFP